MSRPAWIAIIVIAAAGCTRPYGDAGEEADATLAGSEQDATSAAPGDRPRRDTSTRPAEAPLPVPAPQPPVAAGAGVVDPAPAPPPPEPTDVVYTGTLARTPTTVFGGTPYCQYDITFTEVAVKLTLDPAGRVKSAEARGIATERTTPDCPNAPLPPHEHTYAFVPAGEPEANLDVTLAAGLLNKPRAELELVATPREGKLDVKLRLARVDQTAPLVWTIRAGLVLAPAQP